MFCNTIHGVSQYLTVCILLLPVCHHTHFVLLIRSCFHLFNSGTKNRSMWRRVKFLVLTAFNLPGVCVMHWRVWAYCGVATQTALDVEHFMHYSCVCSNNHSLPQRTRERMNNLTQMDFMYSISTGCQNLHRSLNWKSFEHTNRMAESCERSASSDRFTSRYFLASRFSFRADFILGLLLIVAEDTWHSENVNCNIEICVSCVTDTTLA